MLRIFTCKKCGTYPVTEELFGRCIDAELERKSVELANDPTVEALELKFPEGCVKCKSDVTNHPVQLHFVSRKPEQGKA